ncbi:MAG: response regulator [Candidatus Malihini olakiniferum]
MLDYNRSLAHGRPRCASGVKIEAYTPMTIRKTADFLLVDNDPSLLKLLGMRLTSEGFHVMTAESGAKALRVLARDRINLVINDLRMDEMDGLALFSEIQKQQPGLSVIILTAHGSIPDAEAATQQRVFGFLNKPVDLDALYKAIDDALVLNAPRRGIPLAGNHRYAQPDDAGFARVS